MVNRFPDKTKTMPSELGVGQNGLFRICLDPKSGSWLMSGQSCTLIRGRPSPSRFPCRACAGAPLVADGPRHHPAGMFVVSEAEAAAIRTAFDQGGELSAAVELRRLFPGVTDTAQARECARAIAAWKPLPPRPPRLPRGRRRDAGSAPE